MEKDIYPINEIFAPSDHLSDTTILAYVKGELTDEEAHEVERHMVDCEFCANAVEGLEMVGIENIEEITSRLNERIEAEIAGKNETTDEGRVIEFTPAQESETDTTPATGGTSRQGGFRRYFAIAASIVVLAAATLTIPGVRQGIFGGENTSGYGEIIAPDYIITRGQHDETEKPSLDDAGLLYRDGKYAEAAKAFQNFDGVLPDYYGGLSFLLAENYDKAIAEFQAVLDKKDGYSEDAQWYIARAYLEKGDVAKATEIYQAINEKPEGDFSEDAAEMLKKIRANH